MTTSATIQTAADYADAMVTARRAKNLLFLVLLVTLLGQLTIFFVARYTDYIAVGSTTSTTRAAVVGHASDALQYLVGFCSFAGLVCVAVLGVVLLLLVVIMLVGRLIGVSRVTSAFIWCVVLAALLFPWQAFLANATFNSPEFKIPGVLYTWSELIQYARFGMEGRHLEWTELVLKWARFVGFPVLAVIILFAVQTKSNRGLRMALGEADMELAAAAPIA